MSTLFVTCAVPEFPRPPPLALVVWSNGPARRDGVAADRAIGQRERSGVAQAAPAGAGGADEPAGACAAELPLNVQLVTRPCRSCSGRPRWRCAGKAAADCALAEFPLNVQSVTVSLPAVVDAAAAVRPAVEDREAIEGGGGAGADLDHAAEAAGVKCQAAGRAGGPSRSSVIAGSCVPFRPIVPLTAKVMVSGPGFRWRR